jgi:hypothetical protein
MKGGIEILAEMFNKVKRGKGFPDDWKIAVICPVYKGRGKWGEPGNYRGISLLSVLCKIYSGILAGRLRDWLIHNKILSKFQAGFVKDKRSTDNIFVIETTVDRYLGVKRGCIYWCLVDLEKAFDSFDREALWFKMRKKGVSDNMVECIKKMYDNTKFCLKCGGNKVTDFVEQRRGVRWGCSLSPYLFIIFIDDIMGYISEGNVHAPVIGKVSILGLMFADNLAIGSFAANGLQRGIDQIVKYCGDWNLKCNLKKTKILVFKKGGKLKKNEKWFMYDILIEVVNEVKLSRNNPRKYWRMEQA